MKNYASKINKTNFAIITGATGGLGNAFCEEFAKYGKNLLICGTNENKLIGLKEKILTFNKNITIYCFAFNLSNTDEIDKLMNYIKENNIKIDMLINNAGFITEGSIKNASKETLMQAIRINCEGTIYLTKSFLDNKQEREKLNIITIASLASCYPMPYMAIYASTKSLLKNFMLALKYEYKNENTNVLVVQPGAIATSQSMKDAIKAQGFKGKLSSTSPEIIAKQSIKKSILGKSNYIPGFFNKMTKIISAISPQTLQIKLIGKMWKKSQEKRNIK